MVYDDVIAGKYQNRLDYSKDKAAYHREDARLTLQFEIDLAEEFGISAHPKRSTLWQIAWDLGHSAGYTEIFSYYSDLSRLLK